ncbi:MAG: tetraacyldisaccharide 4'-kinase [Bacteroidales bacterium]|nr:tetraacyldisaccharide 4'-kinase [Bacteroidales bacterium]
MSSIFINKLLLFPYYAVLKARHYLYDKGFFKSFKFETPIIVVGNVSAGGTGKTPHTEYLVKTLSPKKRVAVISRGYGRKSRGFRYVSISDTSYNVGDEPLQIKRKFPEILVAVDANRVRAINTLESLPTKERPDIIIMDDAFQHRRVVPSQSIVLIDHSNPPFQDNLIPFGTLRDLPSRISAAHVVVVSKCPPEISPYTAMQWRSKLRLREDQSLLFTEFVYKEPLPVFDQGDRRYVYSNYASVITAVANPLPLEYYLSSLYKVTSRVRYKDHYDFTNRDATKINRMVAKNPKAVLFTTEKDAQRFLNLSNLDIEVKKRLFYLPIEVSLLNGNGTALYAY